MTGSAKQSRATQATLDCLVGELVIGLAKGETRWLLAIDGQDFGGHCAPGSTFWKLWITLTPPSAWTWPRYMVSGACRCLSILIEPRGPSTETSASAFSTLAGSVPPAFSTAAL